jgi:hypothetical protein
MSQRAAPHRSREEATESRLDSETPPPAKATPTTTFVTATHEVLFQSAAEPACDACGLPVTRDPEGSMAPSGSGLYVWARGGDVRYEEPPLCSDCAAAIGLTQLRLWEIEDDEEG